MKHTGRDPDTPVRPDHLVDCPPCNGDGAIVEPDPRCVGNPDAIDPNYIEEPCDRCGGTGKLDMDEVLA